MSELALDSRAGAALELEHVRTVSERFDLFVTLIAQLNRSIRRIKGFEMREMGLRGVHVMILFHLNLEEEGLTQSRLATLCGEDKATISRAVQDLTEKGVIASDPTSQNHRNVKLELTDRGRELALDLGIRVGEAVEAGGGGLSNDERSTLYTLLGHVNENLLKYLGTMERRHAERSPR